MKPVVVPAGIKVTGRGVETGLHIQMDPGRHTSADLLAAIVANNPDDAGKVKAVPGGDIFFHRGGSIHITVGANPVRG